MALHSVVILDDEEWIVRGLTEIMHWEDYGFTITGQFTDAEAALEFIRETEPDLLLLDIHMPKLNGDMMMEMIREEGIPTEFIILSGYSDFSVAQKAIHHGAYGYLLKPLKKSELISCLSRVQKMLDARDHDKISIPIDPMNWEAFCQHAWNRSNISLLPGQGYQILLIGSDQEDIGRAQKKNGNFSKPVAIYGGRTLYMTILSKDAAPMRLDSLQEWCKRQQVTIGVSQASDDLADYANLYRQANCALSCAHLQERTDCFLYTPPNMTEVEQWMNTLQTLYKENDSQRIHWELSKLMDRWKYQGNPASVLFLLSQFTYSVIPAKELQRKNKELNLEKFLFDDVYSKFTCISDINDYLVHLLISESDEREEIVKIPKTVSDLKEYLFQHYSEELNLNRISRDFYLTPTYLCEIFKKHTGTTITGYLLNIRMTKAASLLVDTDCPLVDIAAKVGYADYNYFCRLFKRYFNTSPNAYRKQARQPVQTDK